MEKFQILTTTTEQSLANKTCAVLEEAGIPVMLEHVEMAEGRSRVSGFRVLVPIQHTQTAMRLADVTSNSFYTCKPTCQCSVCVVM
jgi:hypothetical protein